MIRAYIIFTVLYYTKSRGGYGKEAKLAELACVQWGLLKQNASSCRGTYVGLTTTDRTNQMLTTWEEELLPWARATVTIPDQKHNPSQNYAPDLQTLTHKKTLARKYIHLVRPSNFIHVSCPMSSVVLFMYTKLYECLQSGACVSPQFSKARNSIPVRDSSWSHA